MHSANLSLVSHYFDHGATSFPKPSRVALAVKEYIDTIGGTYGRSAYLQAHQASSIVFDAREKLAALLGASDSSRVVFTQNATWAINMAIQGMCAPGKVVLVSPLEHNSVMRPLNMMADRIGIKIKVMPHSLTDGLINPSEISCDDNVCLAVVNHVSNVNGVVQPVAEIKQRIGEVPILVDAAQSAGEIPLNVSGDALDMVALAGHKNLLGPTGTGALYVKDGLSISPLVPGGTGSRSESTTQPLTMPDALEGGTPNIAGIAGLNAALNFIEEVGLKDQSKLVAKVISNLETMNNLSIYKADDPGRQGNLFSFSVAGASSSDIAYELFSKHKIAVRAGLHCSPAAHKTLGTLDVGGTVRICLGHFHTEKDTDNLIAAIADVTGNKVF